MAVASKPGTGNKLSGKPPRAGLLGGSFDPVHTAHVALAKAALKHLQLDWVELVPANEPWQRSPLGASAEHRLNMLQIACANEHGLRINTSELDRPGPTYTIDTLRNLPADIEYIWILGSDQLENFCTWRDWRDIVQIVHLAVARRPGSNTKAPKGLADEISSKRLLEIPFAPNTISASAIRKALADNEPVDNMLDKRVLEYIRMHKLYQQAAQTKDEPSTL